jgi:hypothetical protein
MSPELEQALSERYPLILPGLGTRSTQAFKYGCEHRDGWYPLIDAVCEVLTTRAKAIGTRPPQAVQIKQKFGGLRFYARHIEDEYTFEAISMAELHSFRLCEITGGPGRLSKSGGSYSTVGRGIHLDEFVWVTAEAPLLPPLSTEVAARYLMGRWPSTVRCVPRIPGGWLDLVSTLVEWVSERTRTDPDHEVAFEELREHEGELIVILRQAVDADQGSIAFAKAMARRTDPITGQTSVPR